ncbi:DUF3613 domain-containing protein, partial [Massilia sp. ST3]|nr:DUF3613 domain-containing protein [Massilia sp. ST3]
MKLHTLIRIIMPALAGIAAAASAQAPQHTPLADPIPAPTSQSQARVALETVVSGLVWPGAPGGGPPPPPPPRGGP